MLEAEAEEAARSLNNVDGSPAKTTTGLPGSAVASGLDVKAPKANEVRIAKVRGPLPAKNPSPSSTEAKVHVDVPEGDKTAVPMGDAEILEGGPA